MGRSRGGFGTKLPILCDAKGHPLHFELNAGNVHDSKRFKSVLDGADDALYLDTGEAVPWPLALAGDKGYRANDIDQALIEFGITPMIPTKSNEIRDNRIVEFDSNVYRRRSFVEGLIGFSDDRTILARRLLIRIVSMLSKTTR